MELIDPVTITRGKRIDFLLSTSTEVSLLRDVSLSRDQIGSLFLINLI